VHDAKFRMTMEEEEPSPKEKWIIYA